MHKIKKIFFLGTPEIAVPSLEKIASCADFEIVGVGVFPDRKVGRKQISTACPVKVTALKLGLPIFEIPDKSALETLTLNLDFDLGIVIAFGMIFTQKVLDTGTFVNVHFSSLPQYRGASPVQSAILGGDTQLGITWQKMVQTLDAGDVLFQKEFNIEGQTTLAVWNDFSFKTADFFPEFLDKYFGNDLVSQKQVEAAATFCGKFKKSDGLVDLKKDTSRSIYQKYLAFNPWPGIFVHTKKGDVKLIDINLVENEVIINKIQLPGKKPMDLKDVLQGNPDLFNTSKV